MLVLLFIVNLYSLVKWGFDLLSPSQRRDFIKTYAHIIYRLSQDKKPPDEQPVRIVTTSSTPSLISSDSGGATLDSFRISGSSNEDGGPRPRRPRRRSRPNTDTMVSLAPNGRAHIQPIRPAPPPPPPPPPPPRRMLSQLDMRRLEDERQIERITNRMIKHFGHDGVVVFKTLESAVGIVIANQIFQELYAQISEAMHYA